MHVREQLPSRQTLVLIHRALESVQEADEGIFGRRTGFDVPRHRNARLPARAALNGPIYTARSTPDCNVPTGTILKHWRCDVKRRTLLVAAVAISLVIVAR